MFYKNNMYNYEFRDLNAFDEFILGWGGTAKLFHSICIILCSCQRWSRVPIFPHLHQRLLVLGFILVFVKWCFFLSLSLSLSFFLPRLKAWGSLFPDQRSNLWSPALEIQSLNHWTTRAIPPCGFGLLFPDDWFCRASFPVLIGPCSLCS